MASSSSFVSSTPSKTNFIQELRLFKTANNIKLKKLFDRTTQDARVFQLRNEFLQNPTIRNYLGRSSAHLAFDECNPCFDVSRVKKLENDYYEHKIYSFHTNNKFCFLPFRENITTTRFYTKGVIPEELFEGRTIRPMPIEGLIRSNRSDLRISSQADVYKLRNNLAQLQFMGSKDLRFILTPHHKDGHASTFLCILKKDTAEILTTILINSSIVPRLTDELKMKFNYQASDKGLTIEGTYEELEPIYDRISAQLAGKNYGIDAENKVGYILDKPYAWMESGYENVMQALSTGTVNHVHVISKNVLNGTPRIKYIVHDGRYPVFLDASHSLQTHQSDLNCGLYTFNFIQAVVSLFEKSDIADQAYNWALQLHEGTDEEKLQAKTALVRLFSEEIKPYLPYYLPDGSRKDDHALKELHLRQRWDIGRLALEDQNYQETVGFLKRL